MENPLPTEMGAAANDGTFPAADAAALASVAAEAAPAAGGKSRVRRRVLVRWGARGVFAPDGSGVWRLANGGELAVLEGLGGSKDGVALLRALDEALAAGLAGPGDLRLLVRCFDLLDNYSVRYWASAADDLVADDLVPAMTAVCAAWDSHAAAEWLCWALAAPLQDNLARSWWVGAGWECWEAHSRNA